jgi:molecular chaperone DnaK (HSP70)
VSHGDLVPRTTTVAQIMSNGPTSVNTAPKKFHGPWDGPSKIAIGIDIGTTQSGVAFAYLQEGRSWRFSTTGSHVFIHFLTIYIGAEQTIHRVTQWPGQESHNQHGKIPTVVWYDADKKVQ